MTKDLITDTFIEKENSIETLYQAINNFKILSSEIDKVIKELNKDHKNTFNEIREDYVELCKMYYRYTIDLKWLLIKLKNDIEDDINLRKLDKEDIEKYKNFKNDIIIENIRKIATKVINSCMKLTTDIKNCKDYDGNTKGIVLGSMAIVLGSVIVFASVVTAIPSGGTSLSAVSTGTTLITFGVGSSVIAGGIYGIIKSLDKNKEVKKVLNNLESMKDNSNEIIIMLENIMAIISNSTFRKERLLESINKLINICKKEIKI